MIDGNYKITIKLAFSLQPYTAMARFDNGIITGNDDFYTYQGEYELVDNMSIQATIQVSRYQETDNYVISRLPNFTLNLNGSRAFRHFELRGNVVEEPETQVTIMFSLQSNLT